MIVNLQPDESRNQESERERILASYFKVASIKGDNWQLSKQFLLGAVWAAIATPLLFYLRFGSISWFSISFTIFLVVLCLLFALGFYVQTKSAYHTSVPMERSLADRIGAFWLVACAFGPLFGWIITAVGLTENTWKWQYGARAFLAIIVPVITAVPLIPYARGKAALIAVPLLLIITALPVSSCLWVLADMHDGPATVSFEYTRSGNEPTCRSLDQASTDLPCEETRPAITGDRFQVVWLTHTRRVLAKQKLSR
ncbi:MAG TPA: hypothetical protein VKD91_19545 [Pyrinomonadaceae bacterium]|nr:hypothetical protein [Pyrinomonadaceae bacterium]